MIKDAGRIGGGRAGQGCAEEAAFVAPSSGEVTSWKWPEKAGRDSHLVPRGVTRGVGAGGTRIEMEEKRLNARVPHVSFQRTSGIERQVTPATWCAISELNLS